MTVSAGKILLSTPALDDPDFDKVVIFIAEYNANGALGFVINKIFPRAFNELIEFKQSMPMPLYEGGPVEQEHLFFLHRRPDLIEDGIRVIDSIYLGGDFKKAVQCINDKLIAANDIKLFIGYSGWEDNQLEDEIAEGSWLVTDTNVSTIFSDSIASLWEEFYTARG
ncbi:YqgE/AlgH family protein [Ferruginibacter sp. SUN106]|uniref:YqgE/AlgH family protein n=1 Tax=Ferruginibacter sp. SUN106 TaxID=2978348 RepID=UPI003D36FD06